MSNQKEDIGILLDLIKENPTLKIVPMVARDIIADIDFYYWMGSWGNTEIDDVYHADERIYFRSTDEEELIEKYVDIIFDDEYPNHRQLNAAENEEITKEAVKMVNELEWEKSIIVRIEMP